MQLETKAVLWSLGNHEYSIYREKQARHWKLEGNVVTELDLYKSSGMVKNYANSSRLDMSEAIEKTREKLGMLLNGCINCRKTTLLVYIDPIRTGGGRGVFHQFRGFLQITLEVIKVHSPN